MRGIDGTATFENGIITIPAYWINGFSFESDGNEISVTLATTDKWGITVFNSATLNFSGIINVSKDGHGFSGNGSQITSTTVNILGGTINVPDGAVIYQPQISTLNISGGSLTATGEKAAPVTDNDDFEYTGDVIFIEEYNSTLGNDVELTATITGLHSVKNTTDNAKIFYYTAE